MLAAFLAVAGGNPLAQLDNAARFRLEDPSLLPGEKLLVAPATTLVRRYAPDVIIGSGS